MAHSKQSFAMKAIAAAMMFAAAPAGAEVLYSSVPDSLPGNVPSIGFEATSTSEFGDRVKFVAGTSRVVRSVTVVMSSWGCESGGWTTGDCLTTPGATFTHPITLNLYNDGASGALTPGATIATRTQSFAIPYRPSASPECTGGRWSKDGGVTCYNGLATEITFVFPYPVAVPDTVIWGVAYNTSYHGYAPVGVTTCNSESGGCGYDSLNVGVASLNLVGEDVDPDGVYANSTWPGFYCDSGAGGAGFFRLDDAPGCWTGYRPLAEFLSDSADACKDGGWRNNFPAGTFRNQGGCVSYFQSNKGGN